MAIRELQGSNQNNARAGYSLVGACVVMVEVVVCAFMGDNVATVARNVVKKHFPETKKDGVLGQFDNCPKKLVHYPRGVTGE